MFSKQSFTIGLKAYNCFVTKSGVTLGVNKSLISLPVRFFARKSKTSTIYKATAQPKPQDAIKPSRLQKESLGDEAKEVSRQRVPGYLPDEIKFQRHMETDFTAEKEMQDEVERIQKKAKTKALAEIVMDKDVDKFVTQDFDRFDQNYVDHYNEAEIQKTVKIMNDEEFGRNAPKKFEIDSFAKPERLSKRLSRLGICSRRQAERMIQQGIVKVDGQLIDQNVPVSEHQKIQIGTNKPFLIPHKPDTRIWLYHKPRKLICTRWDPEKRPTVFQQLSLLGLKIPHIIAVGRLDFLSEGLMVLTNDGDLARALELPSSEIERTYRVRVFGRRFDEKKLDQLRRGFKIKGRKYGPYVTEIIKRQTSNTWLHMKLYEGKNNEIRRVMRKFSLRVNRLIRQSYGQYTLGLVPNPNDLAEVRMTKQIKTLLFKYYKEKAQESQERYHKERTEHLYLQTQKQEALEAEQETKQKKLSEAYVDLSQTPSDKPLGLGERLLRGGK
ncbi:unnamed protein product [Moneuplotes crassus]|uniref:RNA-binding S4 domain-containing protein n=1 Tax=Euplotes crassus TaxID=5936 RepID=A0AAD1UC66_EUPCR|nr:unnamed protein product [Moneuplotes crassus]